jgi:hypothetical protein
MRSRNPGAATTRARKRTPTGTGRSEAGRSRHDPGGLDSPSALTPTCTRGNQPGLSGIAFVDAGGNHWPLWLVALALSCGAWFYVFTGEAP